MSRTVHLILSSSTNIMNRKEVNEWRLRSHNELDEMFASTQLPERPDYAWVNEVFAEGEEANGRTVNIVDNIWLLVR